MVTLVLLGAALVFAFGYKICGVVTQFFLSALSQGGWLKNIPLDDKTKISISCHRINISIWSSIWAFLRSPTQMPLVYIEVPSIHVLVDITDKIGAVKSGEPKNLVFDTTISLHSIHHPLWKPVIKWIHRGRGLFYFIHLVSVNISDVTVDIIDSRDELGSCFMLQHGSICVHAYFDTQIQEVCCNINIANNYPTKVIVPVFNGSIALAGCHLKISIPISRGKDDLRSPLPSTFSAVVDSIMADLEFVLLLQCMMEARKHTRHSNAVEGNTIHAGNNASIYPPKDYLMVLLRLLEAIPGDMSFLLHRVQIRLVDKFTPGIVDNRMDAVFSELELRFIDQTTTAVATGRFTDTQGQGQKRQLTINLGPVDMGFDFDPSSDRGLDSSASLAKLDYIQAIVEAKLDIIRDSVQEEHEANEEGAIVSCTTKITGECRGLTVTITKYLQSWILSVYGELERMPLADDPLLQDISLDEDTKYDSLLNWVHQEMEVQFKVARSEVLFLALDSTCPVLPDGVPSLQITIEEMNMCAHPFVGEEPLGVRSMADVQCSRLKVSYTGGDRLVKTTFLSLDFARLFIKPMSLMNTNHAPADVELEAEWLEVKWAPKALHAIGGLLELLIFLSAPFLSNANHKKENGEAEKGDARSPNVPSMRSIEEVARDEISDAEFIKFRCTVKRTLGIFPHSIDVEKHIEYLTVDTFTMSIEETTGRFRITVLQTKVFHSHPFDQGQPFTTPAFRGQMPPRRGSSLFHATNHTVGQQWRRQFRESSRIPSRYAFDLPQGEKTNNKKPYFFVQCFSLEETNIPMYSTSVIDMFVNEVQCEWSMQNHLRVTALVQQITFAVWEMLYRMRSAYARHCTPLTSIYNRPFGVNPPLNDESECLRLERLFPSLISASGSKLHRMHATDLSFDVNISEEIHVKLRIGLFGGQDMPDLWDFGDISLKYNGLEMFAIRSVRVRHTIDKRKDYIFGEFEELLRLRQIGCGRYIGDIKRRNDGMLIECGDLSCRFSMDFPIQLYIENVQKAFSSYMESLSTIMASPWRPQSEIFYKYFQRVPVSAGQMQLWLDLQNIHIICLDRPLESWLERIYPLWMAEIEEQELRGQILDEQISALMLTNVDVCGDTYQEMRASLVEKNAKIYVHNVKRHQAKYQQSHNDKQVSNDAALLSVRLGSVVTDVCFEEDDAQILAQMKALDEATDAIDQIFKTMGKEYTQYKPIFLFFLGINVKLAASALEVRVRNFPTPILTCDMTDIRGITIVCATSSGCRGSTDQFMLTSSLRCFLDLSITVSSPVIYFSPGYLYTLDELSSIAQDLLPLLVLDVDKYYRTAPWDMMRRLVHGRVRLSVEDTSLRLLSSLTSFVVTDYLEVSLHQILINYSSGVIDVSMNRLTVRIEPGALSNIAEFSNIKVQIWFKWSYRGDTTLHYVYPIQYLSFDGVGTGGDIFIVNLPTAEILEDGILQPDHLDSALRKFQATNLSVFIRGKITPNNAEEENTNIRDGWTKREIVTRTAIVLYTKHIEWLIHFARTYQKLPLVPFPRRRRMKCVTLTFIDTPYPSLATICKGVTVEDFEVVGLDLAVYQSEKHPIGVRAFINDKVRISGALLDVHHEIFQQDRLSGAATKSIQARRLPLCIGGVQWIVHDVAIIVQDIQVRICTPQSGSRGESLVSVQQMALKVGGGDEYLPTHDNSVPPILGNALSSSNRLGSSSNRTTQHSNDARTRTKTILEHFAIPQYNPYCFRDSDQDLDVNGEHDEINDPNFLVELLSDFRSLGFLIGLSAREARIVITLTALETLIDIIENSIQVITLCIPELLDNSGIDPTIQENTNHTSRGADKHAKFIHLSHTHGFTEVSPKKVTSLAEDPKYGAIFYQGANDTSRETSRKVECTSHSEHDQTMSCISSDQNLTSQPEDHAPEVLKHTVVESFFMVKFLDCQISVQDQLHKGSVLLALNGGILRDSISSDSSHELIELKVDGMQVFTAPLDVDVKSRVIWLKALADGSYCPSSYGLLKQVVAPIPTQVTIWIDRDAIVTNKVDVQIPTIQVELNVTSKDILQNLGLAMSTLISAKLAEKKSPDYSGMLQGRQVGGYFDTRSIQQVSALKTELKWKIAHLQWRQACRWNYYLNERSNVAFTAAENVRHLGYEIETSPLFRRRRLSSTSTSSITTNMSITGSVTTRCEIEQFTDEVQRLSQQYESISSVVRSMVEKDRKKYQRLPNVEVAFLLKSASLTLTRTNIDIIRVSMTSLRFKMKQFKDQSGSFALTMQNLSTTNLCPGTPYPDLLIRSSSKAWEGNDMFLRIDAEIATPVGDITVIQHFEVNVHPLQVCITQEVIMHLVSFFSAPSASSTNTQEEKRKEVRSQFLQPPQTSHSSDRKVGSALKKAVRVAGKAAYPLGFGRHDDDASDKRRQLPLIHEEGRQWPPKLISPINETQLLLHPDDNPDHDVTSDQVGSGDKEISEMKDRAKTNILFKRIRIGTIEVVVTYKSKKNTHIHNYQPLEDMRGFEVKIHTLVYRDKTCSPMDLLLRIRRDVILDVLSQVGRNFTNIGNFLRDQFDITRWATFDALAPLKSLSTTVSSLTSISPHHGASVTPLSSLPLQSLSPPSTSTIEPSPRSSSASTHSVVTATTPTTPSTPDSTKVFQLEIPERHLSRRKKHATNGSNTRQLDSPTRVAAPISLPEEDDIEIGEVPAQEHAPIAGKKPKKGFSQLFSKKKVPSNES